MPHPEVMLFLKGLVIGAFLALPTGPAGFMVIRETVVRGFRGGFVASLGGVLTDFCYAVIICFGITAIGRMLLLYELPIRFVCAVALIGIGIGTWVNANRPPKKDPSNAVTNFLTVFSISVSNPLLIISSTVLFTAIGGPTLLSARYEKSLFVLGITLGGIAWWALSLKAVDYLTRKGRMPKTPFINKVFALLVIAFGLAILGGVLCRVFV